MVVGVVKNNVSLFPSSTLDKLYCWLNFSATWLLLRQCIELATTVTGDWGLRTEEWDESLLVNVKSQHFLPSLLPNQTTLCRHRSSKPWFLTFHTCVGLILWTVTASSSNISPQITTRRRTLDVIYLKKSCSSHDNAARYGALFW